jgi:hypothetical protein
MENTARIDRHQLVRLLDTMTPHERQAITHRVMISDIETAAAQEPPPPPRRHARPASQIAAMLPPISVRRRPALRARTISTPEHERPTVGAPPLAKTLVVVEPVIVPPVVVPRATSLGDVNVGGRPWRALVLGALLLIALIVLCVVG